MTNPAIPLRFEIAVEVPGTPEQVWAAIATAKGISSWMMPTELEEREGGTVVFHMGPESSKGVVTGWEPPRRLVYEEDWATLAGQDPTTVTPLVSEFLVETTSGGSCVVHVVTSAFGTGAEWEREFFDDMGAGWASMFDHLRLYLTYFPGQQAASLEAVADTPGDPAAALSSIRRGLGVDHVGQAVELRGASGEVEQIAEKNLLVRVTEPVPGLLSFAAFRVGENRSSARLGGYLFSDAAPEYVRREQPAWQEWLEGLVGAVSTRG
jgi:uncharacterized protein YndB with AHSA1/START domain